MGVLQAWLALSLLASPASDFDFDGVQASAMQARPVGFILRDGRFVRGEGTISLRATDHVRDQTFTYGDSAQLSARFSVGGESYSVELLSAGFPPEQTLPKGSGAKTPAPPDYRIAGGVAVDADVFGDTGLGFRSLPRARAALVVWGVGRVFKNGQLLTDRASVQVFALSRGVIADMDVPAVRTSAADGDAEIHVLVENLPRSRTMPGTLAFGFEDVGIMVSGRSVPALARVGVVGEDLGIGGSGSAGMSEGQQAGAAGTAGGGSGGSGGGGTGGSGAATGSDQAQAGAMGATSGTVIVGGGSSQPMPPAPPRPVQELISPPDTTRDLSQALTGRRPNSAGIVGPNVAPVTPNTITGDRSINSPSIGSFPTIADTGVFTPGAPLAGTPGAPLAGTPSAPLSTSAATPAFTPPVVGPVDVATAGQSPGTPRALSSQTVTPGREGLGPSAFSSPGIPATPPPLNAQPATPLPQTPEPLNAQPIR